jgi:hypothetical protein
LLLHAEICLGIAFYTKDDSTAFVAKLYLHHSHLGGLYALHHVARRSRTACT